MSTLHSKLLPNSFLESSDSDSLPHFSKPKVVEDFGHKERLTWTYYVKQGRPTTAFCRLCLDEGLTHESLVNNASRYVSAAHEIIFK